MIEERYIYHPSSQVEGSPGDLGLEFQEASFSAADGTRLHGWLVPGHLPPRWRPPMADLVMITLASLGGMVAALALALPHHLHLRHHARRKVPE
ncbi:MAG: hypothetical protein IH998_08530 [Proteobacteria bacterium]|nr:hypothetical protein [Pseudomonadota bacterium]